jgi:hypothetical protein
MNKIVGKDASDLILNLMKLVYHIDDEYTITTQSRRFVDALVKLVGESLTNSILFSIVDQLESQTVYF